MRRRRKPSDAPKSALFTFLDVLTCTMGLLILLLVAIAAQTRNQAQAQADAARSQHHEDEQLAWDEMQRQIAAMRAQREQAAAELARRRAALEEAEALSRRLADELAELEAARGSLEKVLAGNPTSEQQAELRRLQARIAELQANLDKARKTAASQSESFAIVPYQGPNQTRRRPIYIECRANSVVLQPEGILLTAHDFEGPMGPSNPLAAGVRAAEQYLKRNQMSNQREAGEPYPLLLVRPDGIESYYAARAALKSWGADFGYELVEQDWKLDYKSPDPELVAVESRAVEEGRERQLALMASISSGLSGRGGGGSGSFRVAPGGGLMRESGGGLSSSERPSFRVTPDGRIVRENSPRSTSGSWRRGSSLASRGKHNGDDDGDDDDNKLKSGTSGDGDELPLPPRGGQPGAVAANRSAGAGASSTPGGDDELPPRKPLPSSGQRYRGAGSSAELASAQRAGTANGSAAANAAATASDTSTATASGNAPAKSGGQPQSPFLRNDPNQSAGASGGGPPGATGGQPSDGATATDQQQPLVLPQQMFGQREPTPKLPSLADSHGKNWALPDASRGSFPVTRPIRIQCREDGLTLLPESPGGDSRRVPFGPRTASSMDALVTAVWERMDSWGIAGKGLYWRPELHIETTADGTERLADLKALLADSGVAIYEKPAAVRAAAR